MFFSCTRTLDYARGLESGQFNFFKKSCEATLAPRGAEQLQSIFPIAIARRPEVRVLPRSFF